MLKNSTFRTLKEVIICTVQGTTNEQSLCSHQDFILNFSSYFLSTGFEQNGNAIHQHPPRYSSQSSACHLEWSAKIDVQLSAPLATVLRFTA